MPFIGFVQWLCQKPKTHIALMKFIRYCLLQHNSLWPFPAKMTLFLTESLQNNRQYFHRYLICLRTHAYPGTSCGKIQSRWFLRHPDSVPESSGQGSCNSRTGGLKFVVTVHIATYFLRCQAHEDMPGDVKFKKPISSSYSITLNCLFYGWYLFYIGPLYSK